MGLWCSALLVLQQQCAESAKVVQLSFWEDQISITIVHHVGIEGMNDFSKSCLEMRPLIHDICLTR